LNGYSSCVAVCASNLPSETKVTARKVLLDGKVDVEVGTGFKNARTENFVAMDTRDRELAATTGVTRAGLAVAPKYPFFRTMQQSTDGGFDVDRTGADRTGNNGMNERRRFDEQLSTVFIDRPEHLPLGARLPSAETTTRLTGVSNAPATKTSSLQTTQPVVSCHWLSKQNSHTTDW